MSLVVLLILGVVWAIFLVPQVLRARAEGSPADSIGAFRRQLSVLERTSPATVHHLRPAGLDGYAHSEAPWSAATGTIAARPAPAATSARRAARAQARKRRKDILVGLLATMGATLLLAMLTGGGAMLKLHLIVDILFAAYVTMLIRMRNMATERDMKLRFLPAMPSAEPAMLLRRSGS